ncbi:hypothetical protein PR048_019122 [Dryococelus australis]|uniref:Uncharacterized protein n=1 Tax=Dryococelus australis TaxID=614101 RepID=A0ABQ9H2Q9_9NEOP|nr:hypothetical protein PR048_019122 [Dryococelus australis]
MCACPFSDWLREVLVTGLYMIGYCWVWKASYWPGCQLVTSHSIVREEGRTKWLGEMEISVAVSLPSCLSGSDSGLNYNSAPDEFYRGVGTGRQGEKRRRGCHLQCVIKTVWCRPGQLFARNRERRPASSTKYLSRFRPLLQLTFHPEMYNEWPDNPVGAQRRCKLPREEGLGKESATAFVWDPPQHSPGVISRNPDLHVIELASGAAPEQQFEFAQVRRSRSCDRRRFSLPLGDVHRHRVRRFREDATIVKAAHDQEAPVALAHAEFRLRNSRRTRRFLANIPMTQLKSNRRQSTLIKRTAGGTGKGRGNQVDAEESIMTITLKQPEIDRGATRLTTIPKLVQLLERNRVVNVNAVDGELGAASGNVISPSLPLHGDKTAVSATERATYQTLLRSILSRGILARANRLPSGRNLGSSQLGGAVTQTPVSLLASHPGEPGSTPGRVTTPGFSHVGIVPDDAAGRLAGFSQGSPVSPVISFRRCSILTSITLIDSEDLAPISMYTGMATFRIISLEYEIRHGVVVPLMRVCPLSDWLCTKLRATVLVSDWLPPAASLHSRIPRGFWLLFGNRLDFTVLYELEPVSFFHWLPHKREVTPFPTELSVIRAHNCEGFIYWRRITQSVSNEVWSNDKLIAKNFYLLGSIPGAVAHGFSYAEQFRTIPLFSGFSPGSPVFFRPYIPVLFHYRFTLPSALKTTISLTQAGDVDWPRASRCSARLRDRKAYEALFNRMMRADRKGQYAKMKFSCDEDKIVFKRVYSEVTFSIGSEFFKHAPVDSAPITNKQRNMKLIPYCQMWCNTRAAATEVRPYKGLCSLAYRKWGIRGEIARFLFPSHGLLNYCRVAVAFESLLPLHAHLGTAKESPNWAYHKQRPHLCNEIAKCQEGRGVHMQRVLEHGNGHGCIRRPSSIMLYAFNKRKSASLWAEKISNTCYDVSKFCMLMMYAVLNVE